MPGSDPLSVRSRLLEAAAAAFAEKGYDGTRVGDIARRAGLSTGAIYSQFANKSDLLMSALVERTTSTFDTSLEKLRQKPYDEALLGASMVFRQIDEPLLLDAIAAAQRDDGLADRLRADFREREQGTLAFVLAAQEKGDAPKELSAEAVARLSMVLRVGTYALGQLGFERLSDSDLATLSRRIVEALVRADDDGTGS